MAESFISVGALGDGFAPDARTFEPVTDLAGKSFDLDLPELGSLTVGDGVARFGDAEEVEVRITSVRPGIYLIDGTSGPESTTVVLDTNQGLVTLVRGTLPDGPTREESAYTRIQRQAEPTGVETTVSHGRVSGSTAPLHEATTELVGMRNRYDYSPTEAYEHIYLTPTLYTWHCLKGLEKGLADTDACQHIKIDDQLTLFLWREKIVPTLGVILIDLAAHRTDGKIFGNDGFDTESFVNFPVGAQATVRDPAPAETEPS